MVRLQDHFLTVQHVVVGLERGQDCQQLKLTRVPLLFIFRGLSRKV